MLENILESYFFQNIMYLLFFTSISIAIVDAMKTRDIHFREKFTIKNIDFKFLMKIVCFSLFVRILFEQIQVLFNISQSDVSFDLTLLNIIIFFVIRCIVAPITEEIIFRFGLFEIINKKLNYVFSIIISSIIFSILHGYLSYDTLLLTIISIIWTYAYYKKDNLFYPIVLHILHNLYALISYASTDNIFYIIFGIIMFVIWTILNLNKKGSN